MMTELEAFDIHQADPFAVVSRIPTSISTLLIVGGDASGIARGFKSINPRAAIHTVVLALEERPQVTMAVCEASEGTHKPILASGQPSDSLLFDCIIFDSFLEWTVEPWNIVREYIKNLRPEGTIVLNVPSVEHWRLLTEILGGLDHQVSGRSFSTRQLRWFSLASTAEGIRSAGLTPTDAVPADLDIGAADRFLTAMAPALANLALDPQAYAARAVPSRFIWRARRSEPAQLSLGIIHADDPSGADAVKARQWVQSFQAEPGTHATIIHVDSLAHARDFNADVALFCGASVFRQPRTELLMREFSNGGSVVVLDIDDNRGSVTDLWSRLQDSHIHAVQTSSPAIATLLKLLRLEHGLFQPTISSLPSVSKPTEGDRFQITLCEPVWPTPDPLLISTLNDVAAVIGDRLEFVVVGDRHSFEELKVARKSFISGDDHVAHLASLGTSDVAILAGDWQLRLPGRMRDVLDVAARAVAPLCDSHLYGGVLTDGKTGSLYTDAHDMRRRLLRMITRPAVARQLGQAARDFVSRRHMLAYCVRTFIEWYRHLLAGKDGLREQLNSRLAERQRYVSYASTLGSSSALIKQREPVRSCVFHNAPGGHYGNLMIKYLTGLRLRRLFPQIVLSNFTMEYWGIFAPPIEQSEGDNPVELTADQHVDASRIEYLVRNNLTGRINWTGYGQRMENLGPLEFARQTFGGNDSLGRKFDKDFLVCPVRAGEILDARHWGYTLIPIDFYRDIAEKTGLKLAFVGQTEPNVYTDELRRRFPDAVFLPSMGPLADFQTVRRSENILVSISTFAWLASWLSNARKIVLPVYGLFNPEQFPEINLLPLDDCRYEFYRFPVHAAVPVERVLDNHRQLLGQWRHQLPQELVWP